MCNRDCRTNGDYPEAGDTFSINLQTLQLTVARTDANLPWGLDLRIPCATTGVHCQMHGYMLLLDPVAESFLRVTRHKSFACPCRHTAAVFGLRVLAVPAFMYLCARVRLYACMRECVSCVHSFVCLGSDLPALLVLPGS